MGRVTRIEGRKGWYVEWTNGDGRWIRRRVPGDRRNAEQLLRQAENAAALRRLGVTEAAPTHEMSLDDLMAAWQAHVTSRRQPTTWTFYALGLREVCGWLRERGKLPAEASGLLLADIEAFAAWKRSEGKMLRGKAGAVQEPQGASTRTTNMRVGALTTMLRWGVREGLLRMNPLARWQPIKGPKTRERQSLTCEQIERLLTASPEHLSDVWRFLLGTGLRLGELCGLGWPDVDWQGKAIRVRGETSKGARTRSVPLREDALAVLARQRARAAWDGRPAGPFVFPSAAGTNWAPQLSRRLKRCLIAAKLPSTIDVHTLRHTFGSQLIASGSDVKTVQDLLGHSSAILTLDTYAHALAARKRPAVELLDLPGGTGMAENRRLTRA